MPFVVPTIPAFSFSSLGTGGVSRNLTPIQAGGTSRIGGGLGAYPPYGLETTLTAWGFRAGAAPPGTTSLTVAASGVATTQRGNCFTAGGYARAYADIHVIVEEFEPLKSVHTGLIDEPDPGTEHAEIAPDPSAMLGSFVFKRVVASGPTIIINMETTFLGYQVNFSDGAAHATVLVMPITAGNAYRWWIASQQSAICQAVSGPGAAVSNLAFDFGPVFFAFT
jgi:hypothetical protein